jgi:hypothetical protein
VQTGRRLEKRRSRRVVRVDWRGYFFTTEHTEVLTTEGTEVRPPSVARRAISIKFLGQKKVIQLDNFL